MKAIASALVKAQKAFGPALKTSTNPHFKSRYADLSACVEAVIDALNANGIMLSQSCHECPDGVLVETVFLHESGEMLSTGRLHVPASKQDPQGYGSALTYARRYSLMAACGIAPEDDDGNAANRGAKPVKAKPAGLSERERESFVTAIQHTESVKDLREKFTTAYTVAQGAGDDEALRLFIATKDARELELDAFEPEAVRTGV